MLASGFVPTELQARYADISAQLLDRVADEFDAIGALSLLRIHGDCHPGNILWRATGPLFVDFDDCMTGPAVQDLWMFLAGGPAEQQSGWMHLMRGYESFGEVDALELRLVEPLRSLRILHYAGWLAARWDDPAFPRAFPLVQRAAVLGAPPAGPDGTAVQHRRAAAAGTLKKNPLKAAKPLTPNGESGRGCNSRVAGIFVTLTPIMPFFSPRFLWRSVVTLVLGSLLTACGGGSGGGLAGNPGPTPTVVVSGRVTFDRVPIGPGATQGLNFAAVVLAPVRAVTVEALAQSGGAVLATAVTNAAGDFSLTVPASTGMSLRVKAELLRTGAPAFAFRVRNNTANNALYALDGAAFDSGTANQQRNLHAASGWGGAGYTGPRAAAPFAILDTVYQAYNLVLSAEPNASFPALDLF